MGNLDRDVWVACVRSLASFDISADQIDMSFLQNVISNTNTPWKKSHGFVSCTSAVLVRREGVTRLNCCSFFF